MEYDELKLLKEREPRMHPLASPNNKSRGNAGSDREVRAGERVVHSLDGRSGVLDECLHDGDALVTWDDGELRQCQMVRSAAGTAAAAQAGAAARTGYRL